MWKCDGLVSNLYDYMHCGMHSKYQSRTALDSVDMPTFMGAIGVLLKGTLDEQSRFICYLASDGMKKALTANILRKVKTLTLYRMI